MPSVQELMIRCIAQLPRTLCRRILWVAPRDAGRAEEALNSACRERHASDDWIVLKWTVEDGGVLFACDAFRWPEQGTRVRAHAVFQKARIDYRPEMGAFVSDLQNPYLGDFRYLYVLGERSAKYYRPLDPVPEVD